MIVASLVLSVFVTVAAAQDDPRRLDASAVVPSGRTAADFAPAGWKVENSVSGDLNGDGIADLAITVIEDKSAQDGAGINRGRALVLVLGTKAGVFTRAAVASRLLQCTGCGGAFYGVLDAPANVSITKGVLVVDQDHGSRWVTSLTYRFRYDKQLSKFMLIGFDYASTDRGDATTVSESTSYLTGKRITTAKNGRATTTIVAKKRYGLEEVDNDQFESDATTRLKLDEPASRSKLDVLTDSARS